MYHLLTTPRFTGELPLKVVVGSAYILGIEL